MKKVRPETVVSVVLMGVAVVGSVVLWVESFSHVSKYRVYGEHKILVTDDDEYKESYYENATEITGENGKVKIKGTGANAQEDTIYITSGGSYSMQGTFENIIVSSADQRPVILRLDGAEISSEDVPPVYVKKASKLILSSSEESENFIIDDRKKSGELSFDSAIFSVADISFNGAGKISIEGNYRDAVKSDRIIRVMSGDWDITAKDDGIVSENVLVCNGKVSANTGGDSIKSNADNNRGLVAFDGGKTIVSSRGDGIYSTGDVYINSGEFDVFTEPGKTASAKKTSNSTTASDKENLPSAKGIKADKNIYIKDGNVVVESESDDSIHCGADIALNGGNVKLTSGDDAVHADETLNVNGGMITVLDCYEGLEAKKIIVNAGDILINAEDDGINVGGGSGMMGNPPPPPDGQGGGQMPPPPPDGQAGGQPGGPPPGGQPGGPPPGGQPGGPPPGMENMMPEHSEIDEKNVEFSFIVNGGKIRIYSKGDGIDINGSAEINGGDIMAFALQSGPENAFDFDGICRVNGGSFFGTGNPNMAVSPTESSLSNSLVVYPPKVYAKDSVVKIKDSEGNSIIEEKIDGSFGWIGLYGEKLQEGEHYTVEVNDEEIVSVQIKDTITEIQCETEDGQALPGMQPPPDMQGGGNQPPPPPDGQGGGNQPPPGTPR